ncbi:MAG: O-antigen polymerase [Algoriphagus sp.]|uniref:O-antigen polymerase n=1 Tax=Algoriphagus sp. TaxID=1872435 RepID=UPI003298B0D8
MLLGNLLTLISIIVLSYFWYLDALRSNFIFTPIKLFILVTFLYLILPSIIIPNFFPVSLFWSYNSELIEKNHAVILIFIIFFLLPYRLFSRFKFPEINFNFNNNAFLLSIFFLLISIIVKAYMINQGMFFIEDENMIELNSLPRFVRLFNNLHLWGLMIFTISYFKNRFVNKFSSSVIINYLFYFYFIFTLSIPLLQGRRFGVLFPIITVLVIYLYYNHVKFSKLLKYGTYLSLIFLTITIFRQAQIFSIANTYTFNLSTIFASIQFLDIDFLIESSLSRIFNVYVKLNRVIEFSFDNTYTPFYNPFRLAFTGLIPSFLWSDKPNLSIGNSLGKELGLLHSSNDLIGINVGWIGEGFYHSGIFGVVLAALLFSSSIVILVKIFNNRYDSGKVVLLMYVIFLISGYQMELAFSFNSFFKGSIFLIFILYILSKLPNIIFKS